jgi:hypothetical protein
MPLGLLSQGGGASGGNALTLISTAYGTGSSGTITFSSIPSTFKHLQLRVAGRNTTTDTTGNMYLVQLNSDTTAANYKSHRLFGSGTSVSSDESSAWSGISFGYTTSGSSTASAHSAYIMDIMDYSLTTKNKTTRTLGGFYVTDYKQVSLTSGVWLNTSAVTSLTIETYGTDNFTSTSRFSLYGVS